VFWLTVVSVLILGEILELLSGAMHPKEGLILGIISVPCHEDVIICLSFLGSKVIAKRMA
jgi:hypothetical protein